MRMWEETYAYMDILNMTTGDKGWTWLVKEINFVVADDYQMAHVQFVLEERKYCFNWLQKAYIKAV